tara:strand:+ start:331 stop:540 length:210 start_codon:yes stop_codon:yes gene_type:complete
MKTILKSKLPPGTYVNDEVYNEMAKQTNWFLDRMTNVMAKEFADGFHRKVTIWYVKSAFAKTIMGDEEE